MESDGERLLCEYDSRAIRVALYIYVYIYICIYIKDIYYKFPWQPRLPRIIKFIAVAAIGAIVRTGPSV